LQISKLAQIIW